MPNQLPNERLPIYQQLEKDLASLTLVERLRQIVSLSEIKQLKAVFTTSFGIEDQLITHNIFDKQLDIKIITLDTGRLFPETYSLWQQTEEHYGKRIEAKYPKSENLENLIKVQGINEFYYALDMRKNCCKVRKIEPLERALKDAHIWVTGLRRDQSAARQIGDFISFDQNYNIIKANPLFDWSREDVVTYTKNHNVPVNGLH